MVETTSIGSPWLLAGFLGFVVAMLALDLGVFHRKDHEVKAREALGWSAFWVSLALVFNLGVWHWFGSQRGVEFLSAYLIEKSLSVDNVFVFVVIFGALGIPAMYQHRVLFWGILSALVLRGAMILAGAALYWHDSGGLQAAWITSPTGIAYTLGGLAALLAFVGGLVLIGPSIAEQAAVQDELARGDGVPTADQHQRLARAEGRMRLSSQLDLPLLLLAGLTMAVGRYLY